MKSATSWLIYGATGETGQRIVRQALAQGHRPLLAGRSASKLEPLAKRLNLPWQAVDLDNPHQLEELLASVALVVNVANPFATTRPPLLAAALNTGTHYLDLANDMASIEQLFDHDEAARQAQICVMSGVGFGTVASGCLLKHLHQQLPGATQAEIVSSIYTDVLSPGAMLSSVAELGDIGMVIQQGKRHRLARKDQIKTGSDRPTLVAAPMGDLQAAYAATAIPNIQFYLALGVPFALARLTNGYLGLLTKINQRWIARGLNLVAPWLNAWKRLARASDEQEHSSITIRLEHEDGRSVTGTLRTGEGYEVTAQVTVLAVEKILADPPQGALLPSQAFPANFILEIQAVDTFSIN